MADCTESNGLDAASQAANRAVAEGMVVVVAAGNASTCNLPIPSSRVIAPAAADDVITVASSSYEETVNRDDDVVSEPSLRGPRLDDGDAVDDEQKPDVAAPGDDVNGSGPAGVMSAKFNTASEYWRKQGTSMAAPHVAGLAALLIQANPAIRPLSVKKLIIDTAQDFGPVGWDEAWGHGLIDGFAAMNALMTTPKTDLKFDVYCHRPGEPTWYLSPDITPADPTIVEGEPNMISAVIKNDGPEEASDFEVRLGVYNFGNGEPYYNICTIPVTSLASGAPLTVSCPWTPSVSGSGTVHACLKAEIVYAFDSDYQNNCAQHNIQIEQAGSPARFRMEVVNPTGEDLTIRVLNDLTPHTGWRINQSETTFFMGALDCPRVVNFTLTPTLRTRDHVSVNIRIVGINHNQQQVDLGGVGLVARPPRWWVGRLLRPVGRAVAFWRSW